MRVLVAVASRHGSTRQIGDRIGATLRDVGLNVHFAEMDRITCFDNVDDVVLGNIRDHEKAVHAVAAVESRLFGGDLDLREPLMGEREINTFLRVPVGDFRIRGAVQQWAGMIARALVAEPVSLAGGRTS